MITEIFPSIKPLQQVSTQWRKVFAELEKNLAHVVHLGKKSSSLIVCHGLQFESQGVPWHIPKTMFLGARGSGTPIKVGIFSGFETSDLNLSIALAKFTAALERNNAQTKDFALFIYPVMNPRSSREEPTENSHDFWSRPDATEARFLKQEIKKISFDGIIHLVAAKNNSASASTSSRLLGSEVVQPALQAIQRFLPIKSEPTILPPTNNSEKSFQITLTLPEETAYDILIPAVDIFIREILQKYRLLISHAQNI